MPADRVQNFLPIQCGLGKYLQFRQTVLRALSFQVSLLIANSAHFRRTLGQVESVKGHLKRVVVIVVYCIFSEFIQADHGHFIVDRVVKINNFIDKAIHADSNAIISFVARKLYPQAVVDRGEVECWVGEKNVQCGNKRQFVVDLIAEFFLEAFSVARVS